VDRYSFFEILVIHNLIKRIFLAELSEACGTQKPLKYFLLDLVRIFYEKLDLMNPLFHDPSEYGVQDLHGEQTSK
jgi:hypothetical protein